MVPFARWRMERNNDRECRAVADLTGSVHQARVSQFPVGAEWSGAFTSRAAACLFATLVSLGRVPVRGRNPLST